MKSSISVTYASRGIKAIAAGVALELAFAAVPAQAQIIGWAVGDSSTILHTDGSTWTKQTTGLPTMPQTNLRDIEFADASNGWIAGFSGRILHTSDGGTNWSLQASGTTQELHGLSFTDAQTGWAVGGSGLGTILHTVNGGTTWTAQAVPSTINSHENLNAVDFVNATTGWAVGAGGSVLHTTDGGANWVRQASLPDSLFSLDFVDASHGWIVANNRFVYRTGDGGATWEALNVANGAIGLQFYGVDFRDANNGWIVGIGGAMRHTADGGQTWDTQTSGATTALRAVEFTDALTGWTVGSNLGGSQSLGTLLHTTNGGVNWLPQADPENPAAHALWGVEFFARDSAPVPASVPDSGSSLMVAAGVLGLIVAHRRRELRRAPSPV